MALTLKELDNRLKVQEDLVLKLAKEVEDLKAAVASPGPVASGDISERLASVEKDLAELKPKPVKSNAENPFTFR